jgi:hypothetical protein
MSKNLKDSWSAKFVKDNRTRVRYESRSSFTTLVFSLISGLVLIGIIFLVIWLVQK